jgi:glycerophosphoryl diester phosphodiesterase
MKKIIFSLFFIMTFLIEASAQNDIKRIEVHGHRGSRGTAPENTIAAFKQALKAGVDYLELDMDMTADGFIVISHDKFINKEICLDSSGKKIEKDIPIISLTLKELKQYDCGSLKNPKFERQIPSPGEKIPTLNEVFELVLNSTETAAKNVKFNMETKITPGEPNLSPSPSDFAKAVIAIVKNYNMADRVIIQSFDWRTLSEIKKIEPKIKISQLTEANYIDPEVMTFSKAEIISPSYKWITPEYIKILHKAGKKVVPWTINEPKYWELAIKEGVDGIITDYPADLISWLKEKGLR